MWELQRKPSAAKVGLEASTYGPTEVGSSRTTSQNGAVRIQEERDSEVRRIITNAPEPLSTIVAITGVIGLRIGETLAFRKSDVDFAKHIVITGRLWLRLHTHWQPRSVRLFALRLS